MPTSVMLEQIAGALAVRPDQTAAELVEVLRRIGMEATKAEVNSALYATRDRFWTDGVTPPRWRLVARSDGRPVAEVVADPEPTATAATSHVNLYAWQTEALEAWRSRDRRGVVEAVTGTGKTVVGLAAAAESLGDGGKVQVIVPSVELLRQWTGEVKSKLPKARVGQLGDGRHDSWSSCDVLISTVQSASSYDPGLAPRASLLIADECHRYGSATFAEALDSRFHRRLGLSATYLRLDSGNTEFLDPYFGDTCFRMGYRRAIDDNVTAHFKVALVGVQFSASERIAYERANKEAWQAQKWLIESGAVRRQPFGDFMQDVNKLSDGGGGTATWKARAFLKHFADRKRILAETSSKRAQLKELAPALAAADRSIVFTQTIAAAQDAVAILSREGLSVAAVHSDLTADERRTSLGRFADGRLRIIAAPQVLDEGIDVPAADLAVIVAASKTRRQMIQRMGRVLRTKADGRLARFVVLFVEGSSEDPATGAHGDFLEEITDVADAVETFRHDRSDREICDFLNDWRPATGRAARETSGVKQQPAVPARTERVTAPPAPPAATPPLAMTAKRSKRLLKTSAKFSLAQSKRDALTKALFRLGEFPDEVLIAALGACTSAQEFEDIVLGRKTPRASKPKTKSGRGSVRPVSLNRFPPKSKGAPKTHAMPDERLVVLVAAYRAIHGDRWTDRFLPDLKALFRRLAAWSDRGLIAAMEGSPDPREIEHRAKTVSSPRQGSGPTAPILQNGQRRATPPRASSPSAKASRTRASTGAAAGEKPLYRGVGPSARYCTAGCGLLLENCRC